MNEVMQRQLAPFFDEQGRLMRFPAKRSKMLAAVYRVYEQLPAGETWTERELNERLNALHTFGDPATLRREMYDHYLLDRDPYGRAYTVRLPRPDLETFLAAALSR